MSVISGRSAGYCPNPEVPLLKSGGGSNKVTVLQRSTGNVGLGTHHPCVNWTRAEVDADGYARGPPVFATKILAKVRTKSVETMDRIKKACKSGEIADLREAYKLSIDPRTDCYYVPSHKVVPLLNRMRQYHDERLGEAIDSGDKNEIGKAIKECEDNEKDFTFSRKLTEAKKKIAAIERKEQKEKEAQREREKEEKAAGR